MNYASWGTRAAGYIVDALIVAPLILLAVAIEETLFGPFYYVLLFAAVALIVYNRWFKAGATGQTWGRKMVGTRLVSAQTGQPIGAAKAFVRDLAHVVDQATLYIGYLFPLWDAKRQTIADKLVKTVVVTAS